MTKQTRIGIVGYGNIGKGVADAIKQSPDMILAGVFTRRDPQALTTLHPNIPFMPLADAKNQVDNIDVMILCGGSATDLPTQTPMMAKYFTTVDSFDTHAKIPEYFEQVDEVATEHRNVSIISVGWDPGLFSIQRLLAESILPQGVTYTFWGDGVSQGHSDAIRRVDGVEAGIQYTRPIKEAMERVRKGENPTLYAADMHERVCYVVPKEGANLEKIEQAICTMPHYFDAYRTTVHFITKEELESKHNGMPHGGFVIRSGYTNDESQQLLEFALKLDSNPAFTAAVLVAYARAAHRLKQEGFSGAKTVFDIAPRYLSPEKDHALRKRLL